MNRHFSNKLADPIFRKWLVNSVLQYQQRADSPIFSWELARTGSSTKHHNHLSFSMLQPHASTSASANLFRIFIAKKEMFTFVVSLWNGENCIEKSVHLQCGSPNIKYGESLAGELAVDSSSANGGNVSDTNVGNYVGNPTLCRTRLRHTAEGRNN